MRNHLPEFQLADIYLYWPTQRLGPFAGTHAFHKWSRGQQHANTSDRRRGIEEKTSSPTPDY
jgi:hypothetical protein